MLKAEGGGDMRSKELINQVLNQNKFAKEWLRCRCWQLMTKKKKKWSGYMIKGDKISAKLEIIGMAYSCIHVPVYVRSGLECLKGG